MTTDAIHVSSPPLPLPQRQIVGQLYAEHRSWLLGWLRGRLRDPALCEDIAQETFAQLMTGAQLAVIEQPRALLTTIAKHLMASRYRRWVHEQRYLDELAVRPQDVAISPEEHLCQIQALLGLAQILDSLTARVRQAFLMSQVDGLRQAEIADRLDVSLATAKRYIRAASVSCAAMRSIDREITHQITAD